MPAKTHTKRVKPRPSKPNAGRRGAASGRPSLAARSAVVALQTETVAAQFVRGVLTRGEAVPAGQELPPGATHEIVQEQPGGLPTLRRRRFSIR
jgi:hypothetical protein